MRFRKVTAFGRICAVTVIGVLASAGSAHAQRLTPIPPNRGAPAPLLRMQAATIAGSPWTPLRNQPTFLADGAANPILLTDGSVLVQDAGFPDWWKLTPDATGSYVNGTWTQVASMPTGYNPLYHSSAVLPDGRLIVEGGEYLCDTATFNCDPVWTNLGAIYDPVKDFWTPVAPPSGWDTIGDAQGIVLANGTYMQANCCTSEAALLDPKTLTWTATGSGKFDPNDEEGWTLLPSGKVLTVDAYVPIPPFPYIPTGTNSELYNPRTGTWSSGGSTKVQLWDSGAGCGGENVATFEVGPGVLRADGTVFYAGSNTCPDGVGNTAIYNAYSGRWRPGPLVPEIDGVTDINVSDGPAAWEPNDKVLVMASPGFGNPPSFFLEWDGRNLNQVPGPPNAPVDGSFYGNMLVLPTGQILLTDFSNDIEIYTPTITRDDRQLQKEIAPVVLFAPQLLQRGSSYTIYGVRFNGVSQGAAYGDDAQAATNYPLVRITNLKTSHVSYARTHDHSSMAVASDDVVFTHFDIPKAQESGPSTLQVVANGIASSPIFVLIH